MTSHPITHYQSINHSICIRRHNSSVEITNQRGQSILAHLLHLANLGYISVIIIIIIIIIILLLIKLLIPVKKIITEVQLKADQYCRSFAFVTSCYSRNAFFLYTHKMVMFYYAPCILN